MLLVCFPVALRQQHFKRLAENFGGRVSEYGLRIAVELCNALFSIHANDGISSRAHDVAETPLTLLARPFGLAQLDVILFERMGHVVEGLGQVAQLPVRVRQAGACAQVALGQSLCGVYQYLHRTQDENLAANPGRHQCE